MATEIVEPELTKTAAKQLEDLGSSIDSAKADITKNSLAIGKALADAKQLLIDAGCKGAFTNWVATRCGFQRSSAYRYLGAWKLVGNTKYGDRFDDCALYDLSSEENKAAADESLDMARRGFYISHATARQLIDKHRQLAIESSVESEPESAASDDHVAVAEGATDCPGEGDDASEDDAEDDSGDDGDVRSVGTNDDFSDRPDAEPRGEPSVPRQQENPVAAPGSISESKERGADCLERISAQLIETMKWQAKGKSVPARENIGEYMRDLWVVTNVKIKEAVREAFGVEFP